MENSTEQEPTDLQKHFADEPEQITHNPVPPVMPTESTPSKSNPVYLYLLIGLLVLMVIGMFFLRRMAPITPKTTNEMPLSPTEVPVSTTPSIDETVNWKTYTNSVFGFSFKYPEDWLLNEQSVAQDGWLSATVVNANSPLNTYQEGEPDIFGSFEVSLLKKSQYPLLEQINSIGPSLGSDSNVKKVREIGGVNGTQLSLTGTVGSLDREIFFFEKDENIYSLSALWKMGSTENSEIANQILSTFTFTEQKISDQAVFSSFDSSLWQLDKSSTSVLHSKNSCFDISVINLGKISSMKEYIENHYNTPLSELEDKSGKYSVVWQGVEAYTIKATGEGEINSYYVRPGEDVLYMISLNSPGVTIQGDMCKTESSQVTGIIKGVRFL